jgi:hypothetical protein
VGATARCAVGSFETLSRLPPSQPIASGPQSPIVQGTLGVLFVLFLLGDAQQALAIRARRRLEQAGGRWR